MNMRISEIDMNRAEFLKRRKARRSGIATKHIYKYEDAYLATLNRLSKQRDLQWLTKEANKIWDKYYRGTRKRPLATIRFGPGNMELKKPMSYAYGYNLIELAPGQRDLMTLIHELAHMLGYALHSVGFAKAYYNILKDYLPDSVKPKVYDELVVKHHALLKPHYKKSP